MKFSKWRKNGKIKEYFYGKLSMEQEYLNGKLNGKQKIYNIFNFN